MDSSHEDVSLDKICSKNEDDILEKAVWKSGIVCPQADIIAMDFYKVDLDEESLLDDKEGCGGLVRRPIFCR